MTATTAIPEAVRTGLARSCGSRRARCSSGMAAINSTSLGARDKAYLREIWGQGRRGREGGRFWREARVCVAVLSGAEFVL